MAKNVVEMQLVCRVNGMLVVNTLVQTVGGNPKEAVEIAHQAASILKAYDDQLKKSSELEFVTECLTKV